jgi:HAD superfamily hydrolase (TIGR01509 family)
MNAIHRLIGMGGDQLVPCLLGHDNAEAQERRPIRYQELIHEVRPFTKASDLLRRLRDSGLAVVLATSAPTAEVKTLVDLLDIGEVLTAITTADDVASSKPEPDVFTTALTAGSVDPERALVIGDSIWDIRAARAAGLGAIAVETGGFSRHELTEDGAREVYRDVEELFLQVHTSLINRLR